MRNFFPAILLLVCASFPAQSEQAPLLARWIQMAPGGDAEARAVVPGDTCPAATIDGTNVAMQNRATPDDKFPMRLCTVTLPHGAQRVSILGSDLALPKSAPQRILVLGDTGCRIKGATIQACNDPAAWPFPQVAAAAANLK